MREPSDVAPLTPRGRTRVRGAWREGEKLQVAAAASLNPCIMMRRSRVFLFYHPWLSRHQVSILRLSFFGLLFIKHVETILCSDPQNRYGNLGKFTWLQIEIVKRRLFEYGQHGVCRGLGPVPNFFSGFVGEKDCSLV